MARLKTSSGQFGLMGGICRTASDCILAREPSPASPAARWKGSLYLLAEPVPEGGRGYQAARRVVTEIAQAYYAATSPSITTCLTRAFREANLNLFRHNMAVSGHEKITIGVTAAVVRGEELFLAQVLPGQAYVVHQGRVQPFPSSPSWDPEAATMPTVARLLAMGWSEDVQIEFFHSALQAGDSFCLCTSNIGRTLGKADAEQVLLYQEPADVVEHLYRRVHQQGFAEAGAMVVELQPALSRQATAFFSKAGLQERARLVGETISAFGGFLGGEVRRLFQRPKAAGRRPPKVRPRPRPAPPREPEIPPPLARPKPSGPWWKTALQSLRGLFRPRSPFPPLERPKMRIRAPRERRRIGPYFLGAAALIVLSLLIFFTIQGTRARQETLLRELIEETKTKVAQAGQTTDLKEANDLLAEAEQALLSNLTPDRPQPSLEYALHDLRAERDRINHVVRFLELEEVVGSQTMSATMAQEGFPAPCTHCVFQDLIMIGESVYVLEGEQGAVYLYDRPNNLFSPILWPGMRIQGRPVGPILDIAALSRPRDCLPDEAATTWLAAVDADHWLYLHHSGQWESYALSSGSPWNAGQIDMEGYIGNVYILKGEPGQVSKYYCNAYELRPEAWVKDSRAARVGEAVDMTIDGSIYLVLQDGTAQILSRGLLERTISFQDYKARIYPSTLVVVNSYTNVDSEFLYLVDSYGGRVIQLRKEGGPALVRDLRGPTDDDLVDVRAVVIREQQGLCYLVAGHSLYRAVLPPLVAEPAPTTGPASTRAPTP